MIFFGERCFCATPDSLNLRFVDNQKWINQCFDRVVGPHLAPDFLSRPCWWSFMCVGGPLSTDKLFIMIPSDAWYGELRSDRYVMPILSFLMYPSFTGVVFTQLSWISSASIRHPWWGGTSNHVLFTIRKYTQQFPSGPSNRCQMIPKKILKSVNSPSLRL